METEQIKGAAAGTTQAEVAGPEHRGTGGTTRGRSTIAFPYLHLQGCLEIAEGVRTLGVDACEWDQLAARTGNAAQGGTFRQKMLAARVFGLLAYKGAEVNLTHVGQRAINQETAKAGRVEAFLNVPLFSEMYDKLKGRDMPPAQAIEQQMQTLGVAPKQALRARQVFIRSARDAGFFEIHAERMTRPPASNAKGLDGIEDDAVSRDEQHEGTTGGRPEALSPHPLIAALLAQLPAPGTTWEQARCVMWLEGVLISLGMIYENFEELREIEIGVRQPSR